MGFNGFSRETVKFYRDLEKNNSKTYFDSNRAVYDNHVLAPSRDFVTAMGNRLEKITFHVNAIPAVNKSIFRINRDVRFSRDKSPYKTHLALWFWDGDGPRMESSGYYFHLEPGILMLGAGIHTFSKKQLKEFRDSVVDPDRGGGLGKTVKKMMKKEGFSLGGSHYKRIPAGYSENHENARFLLHNGLYASYQCKIPDELYSGRLVDFCYGIYTIMSPFHTWLYNMTLRAED